MACVSNDSGGYRRILFTATDGKRMTIRLGKVSKRDAESIKLRVEHLVAASRSNLPLDGETATWLSGIGDDLASKLAAVGLTRRRATATLGTFTAEYIDRRTDIKPRTRINLNHSRSRLVEFFGVDRSMRDITPGDADAWLLWLKERYADATIGRTVRRAVQFFRAAMRSRLLTGNPFDELKAPSQVNDAKKHFITREVAEKVLAACPDHEWRLLFALSRYGGLRCPSEPLRLTWDDVDWGRNRLRVTSPKTEHHEGKGERWIPIFPELRPHLDAAFDAAAPGTVHVITRYRSDEANLRTQLLRIIKKAGVPPWLKVFQNLRATRATELSKLHPIHVVCAWMGHAALIAQKHYLQVTDDDFDRAAGGAQSGSLGARNPAHRDATPRDTSAQLPTQPVADCGSVEDLASSCDPVYCTNVPRVGLEPTTR